ncbi:unnamed protein product [Peniophora sp. CBMAI 1063]|nr:unnamed protein product [Peniophora sp. CBMAI 1063]
MAAFSWNHILHLYNRVFDPLHTSVNMPHPLSNDNATIQTIASVRPAVLYALVIGIDTYPCPDIPDLAGAASDAQAVYDYLHVDLQVPAEHIVILRNEQATREAIIREIKALASRKGIKKGDPILIYFAGHGIATIAPEGWREQGRRISFIVPYDTDTNLEDVQQSKQAIPDRTIGALLHSIAEGKEGVEGIGDNITVVFDCCHSGSGTRSIPVDTVPRSTSDESRRARGFEWKGVVPATLDQEIVREARQGRDIDIAKGFRLSGSRSHVLLAACRETESAYENHERGYFTHALLRVLRAVQLDLITYKDLMKQISNIPGQTPQCEGHNVDRYLFNARVAGRGRAVYEVSRKNSRLTVTAGSIHGVVEGTTFAIYADRDVTPDTKPFTTLKATKVEAFKADLVLLDPSATAVHDRFKSNSPCFAVQNSVGEAPALRLLTALEDGIGQALENVARTHRVGGGPAIVAESEPRQANFGALVAGDTVSYTIYDPLITNHLDRRPSILCGRTKSEVGEVEEVLSAATRFFYHLHHAPRKGELNENVDVQLVRLKRDEEAKLGKDLMRPWMADGANLIRSGLVHVDADGETPYGIILRNDFTAPLHVWAFYFNGSSLAISQYYKPPAFGSNAEPALPGNCDHSQCDHPQTIRLKGELKGELTIGYGTGGGLPHTFFLEEGQDKEVGFIKLFLSTRPIDLSGIVQRTPFGHANARGWRVLHNVSMLIALPLE